MPGNAEYKERGFTRGNIPTEEDKTYTTGHQLAAESLFLERMGMGNGEAQEVSFELETDTWTARYQPAIECFCLGRMGVGKGAPEKVASELKTDT